jgi:hypothetical protein
MGTHAEVRIGSLIAAGGIVWTAKIATDNFTGLDSFSFVNLPRGPLEVCAIGILIWLHALWRKSVHIH